MSDVKNGGVNRELSWVIIRQISKWGVSVYYSGPQLDYGDIAYKEVERLKKEYPNDKIELYIFNCPNGVENLDDDIKQQIKNLSQH